MAKRHEIDDDRLGHDPSSPRAGIAPGLDEMAGEAMRSQKRDALGPDRELRESGDRNVTEDREMEDDERLEMFLAAFLNAALPEIPELPGFHTCWLSTTNPKDTIPMRMRIGYQLVKPQEIRGWENNTLTNGEFSGYVGVNEMVLAKLPARLYQLYMQACHVKMPLDEASKMRYKAERIKEQARSQKSNVDIFDGIEHMDDHAPTPDFNDPNWRPPMWYIEQMLRRGT